MAEGITVYGAAGAGNPSLQTTRLAVSFAAAASGSMSANTTPEWTQIGRAHV